jgi:demethylmenaquinone methyltransferase/2-methoxy-6-polyprenyl-1,4-benzoquinol methylase
MGRPERGSETAAEDHRTHGRNVADMFGRIAPWYDLLNHVLSLGQDYLWRYRLARLVRPVGRGPLLDLAAGTLDVSTELLRQYPENKVLALDFALPMLAEGARKKIKDAREGRILPVQADGRCLPLPDASVDGATIAFGIRNIKPREDAWREVLRVLKPGARFCVLEFGTGSRRVWKGLYNFYLDKLLPAIGRIVSGDSGAYRYLADTIKSFPDERTLEDEILAAGFARVTHVPLCSGIVFIHVAEKAGAADAERETKITAD